MGREQTECNTLPYGSFSLSPPGMSITYLPGGNSGTLSERWNKLPGPIYIPWPDALWQQEASISPFLWYKLNYRAAFQILQHHFTVWGALSVILASNLFLCGLPLLTSGWYKVCQVQQDCCLGDCQSALQIVISEGTEKWNIGFSELVKSSHLSNTILLKLTMKGLLWKVVFQ